MDVLHRKIGNKIMRIFLVIVGLHWVEHLFQAYQVYVLHLHRSCALGFLGMKYPWLIQTESLHFAFAWLTSLGMLVAGANYFMDFQLSGSCATRDWTFGFLWSVWHVLEHSLLFVQAVSHHYLFHSPVPITIIQLIVPRIELHLFYNSIITYYIVKALIREHAYRNRVGV